MVESEAVEAAVPAPGERAASAERAVPSWLAPLRSRVLRLPGGSLIWRGFVAVIGAIIVVIGIVLIPLPGPGWAIVFLGVGVWATEFGWAKRLLDFGVGVLRRWTLWAMRQSLFVRGLLGLAGLLLLAGLALLGWALVH